ncbi:MAG: broad specificity phosphatase PhoE [Halioglobus sp.]|jgi:broad specificity phosphatase PhoE
MDIFLVRHGEAAAAWGQDPDPGLSDLGKQQAIAATQKLLPQLGDIVQVVSSPLLRAQQTARPLVEARQTELVINNAFREIPAPGPLADRKTWLRGFMKQSWSEQPEELLQWRANALDQLQQLATPTVVFSHFLVLNAIVGAIKAQAETLVFWPDNASITHLKLDTNGELSLVALGAQMDTVIN